MRIVAVFCALAASLFAQPGPTGRTPVDNAASARGKATYLLYCINCHGSLAQGTDQGPDLVRSVVVLRDRLGNGIGPVLRKLPNHKPDLSQTQVADLSHFLKDRIEITAKNRNPEQPPNVLTGNAASGKDYFGANCISCHSVTGDFARVGAKYKPDELQQRFLFPRRKPIAVTIHNGTMVLSGTLERIDDFTVSLRDESGDLHTVKRVAGVEVDVKDPLSRHYELLDQLTDANIHNVVAYLNTLK